MDVKHPNTRIVAVVRSGSHPSGLPPAKLNPASKAEGGPSVGVKLNPREEKRLNRSVADAIQPLRYDGLGFRQEQRVAS